MAKQKREPSFVTPEFTLYFPDLVQPNEMSGKYRVVAAFDEGTDLTEFKAAIKKAAVNKWGDDVPKNLAIPLRTADQEKTPEIWPEDSLHCALSTSWAPALVDRDHNKALTADKFYGGCKCRAVVHMWPYDGVGKNPPGVTVTLDMLQFLSDGERLGGGSEAAKKLLGAIEPPKLADLPTSAADNSDTGPLDF